MIIRRSKQALSTRGLRTGTVAAFVATALGGGVTARAGDLPIPCVAGSCGPAVTAFVTTGNATAVASGNTMRIDQRTDKATLNWASFDVSAGNKVEFNQPSSSSIALNRIHSASPSKIFGAIEANGQIYLVNQNGILFGAGSTVNTAGLIASTLNISDDNFNAGLLAPELLQKGRAALESDGREGMIGTDGKVVLDKDGKPVPVKLVVQQGAALTTKGAGQRILLAGQNVENAGSITTPDGQAIIAAGDKVYLQASKDPNLRGLLVEVDKGGTAWNQLTGQISAARGNITIAGLAVNQDGRLSATTTVNANGSIRLQARDTVTTSGAGADLSLVARNGGTLTVSSGSSAAILPELDDPATAVDDQAQPLSDVRLSGKQVFIESNASIIVPGGNVSVSAAAVPGITQDPYDPKAQIRVHSGAVIDVSGTHATAPVTRNLVTVELRANELSDSPLQRDGAVRGKPLIVDARVGTPLGDISGALKTIQRGVGERLSAGGTVSFLSQGDVMINNGAVVDVSGGRIDYTPGVIQTSQLIGANGRLYDVGSAPRDLVYRGVVNPTSKVSYDRWGQERIIQGPSIGHYDPGYTEGRNGGTLSIAAPVMSLNGDFRGSVITGALQRDPSKMPLGALFQIGDPTDGRLDERDYHAPSIRFVDSTTPLVVRDGAALTGPTTTLELTTDFLTRGGFGRTLIHSNGTIELARPDPLKLLPGSSFSLVASRVDLRADIIAPSSTVSLSSVETQSLLPGIDRPERGIQIGDGVTIDVRGTWTNDQLAVLNGVNATQLTSPIFKDGGAIRLSTQRRVGGTGDTTVALGDGVNLLASGGAWLTAGGSLKGGKGGEISIQAGTRGGSFSIGENTHLNAFGVNGAAGGTFKLEASRIEVVNAASWALPRDRHDPIMLMAAGEASGPAKTPATTIGSALFTDFGFAKFELTGTIMSEPDSPLAAVSIQAGTVLKPVVQTLLIEPGAKGTSGSSANIASFSSAYTPLDGLRSPVSMTFASTAPRNFQIADQQRRAGSVVLEEGATIAADPDSTVSFSGVGGVLLGGEIIAPGGTISASLPTPELDIDPLYIPTLGINVLANARLDVSGIRQLTPNSLGLLTGSVLGGGAIELLADRGSVNVRTGARLLADGGSGLLDLPVLANASAGYTRSTVGSAGGEIHVRAPESILLAGTMSARAGASDTNPSPGGMLNVQLTRERGFETLFTSEFPSTPRVLQLTNGQTLVGTTAPNGLGILDAKKVAAGGFGSLSLEAQGTIEIDSGIDLRLAQQLTLESVNVRVRDGGNANLSAAYVSFGRSLPKLNSVASSPGTGTLTLSGDLIDLVGSSAVSGVSSVVFASTGDIRLRGVEGAGVSRGDLISTGDLTLRAERVYPTTETQFTIQSAGGKTNVVKIEQADTSPAIPLSVAGHVTIQATDIVQAGTLLAPFGQITLSATDSVTLAPGSLTSVSAADTTMPFGTIVLGDWRYTLGASDITITSTPVGQIGMDADKVDMQAGSTVDLRGGGDLYAYEWVPGTGGTKDALAAGTNPNLFVVFPSMRGQSGVYDPMAYVGAGIGAADTVSLSGSDLLPAGVYPLLPARYALLPGAVLVEARPDFAVMAAGGNSRLPDGATVVAGRRTFLDTGLGDSVYSGFAIRDGSYGRQLATYNDYHASTFFPTRAAKLDLARAAIPADAAALSILMRKELNAAGTVQSAGAKGGLGASIDLSAPNLEIVGNGAGTEPEAVHVQASAIEKWNAGRLLFGARRSVDGTSMDLVSDAIRVDAGVSLVSDEVMLAARNEIRLDAGARVASRSNTSARASDPQFATRFSKLGITGDGAGGAAVLAVSDVGRLQITRPGPAPADPNAPPPDPVTLGAIFVDRNGTVTSRSALLVDAPGGGELEGTLDGAGASWDVVSSRLSFTDTPADSGLTITPNIASALGQAYNARLASGSTIDFRTSVAFGAGAQPGATLTDLTLVASGLRSIGDNNVVTLGAARNLTLEGAAAGAPFEIGSGSLNIKAEEITVGPGTLAVTGFGNVLLDASADLRSSGDGTLQVGGPLDITTPLLTASAGANLGIESTGAVSIQSRGSVSTSPIKPAGLGASLSIEAPSIDLGTTILQPSGVVSLKATGNDASLRIGSGAVIDASGTLVNVLNRQETSPAGSIYLTSDGTLTAQADARLAVSAGSSAGGSIVVQTKGLTTLASTLQGGTGASFDLFAGSLTDFAALNRALESNGFSGRRAIRVSSGNLVLDAGESITARSVTLAADRGNVNVFGTITAKSDNERSSISLFGTQGVLLGAGGALHADGVGSGSRGGIITLGTRDDGVVNLASGSTISTSGIEKGRVTIRANAGAPNFGLAPIGSTFEDVAQIGIESYQSIALPSGTLDQTTYDSDLANYFGDFASTAQSIRSLVGTPSGATVVINPGLELTYDGDLRIGSIAPSQFLGQPTNLSVRATGKVTIAAGAEVSDGFALFNAGPDDLVPGASLRFAAGSDLTSANALALAYGSQSDFELSAGALVRTTTGDLGIAAAHDIKYLGQASVYTAGKSYPDPSPDPDLGSELWSEPRGRATFNYPTGGGQLSMAAGHDILGFEISAGVGAWQPRAGKPENNGAAAVATQWGVDIANFKWNAGSLGGGDVSVRAGHDVLDLTVAAADSGKVLKTGELKQFKGGVLSIDAGNDISSVFAHVTHGTNLLHAGGQFGRAREIPLSTGGKAQVGSLFSLEDAALQLVARNGIAIETVFNPTIVAQPGVGTDLRSFFYTYGPSSRFDATSAAGEISFAPDFGQNANAQSFMGSAANSRGITMLPSTISLHALSGDVRLKAGGTLFESDSGQLDLLAGNDLLGTGGSLMMSDLAPGDSPSILSPLGTFSPGSILVLGGRNGSSRHLKDDVPVQITAGRDIVNQAFTFAKLAQVRAGRDIVDLSVTGQNVRANDVTSVWAGRDIRYTSATGTSGLLQLGGPGAFAVLAGRDVDLGFSAGITTVGATLNPTLSDAGADISVVAGFGPGMRVDNLLSKVIDASDDYRKALIDFINALTPNEDAAPSYDTARSQLLLMDAPSQLAFVSQVFFKELVKSGREVNADPTLGFDRGYAAIDALFPGSRPGEGDADSPYKGDLLLTFSRIYSISDGTISLFAPGGLLNVGLANPPKDVPERKPSDLGIVAQRAGDVRVFTSGDVLVNASRIFTLGGGDIAVWSTLGDIDAGRGAKSAISAPPPIITVDSLGNVKVDFGAAVAGSGIRTIVVAENTKPGNVDLIAPAGIVNAGDAGIGAAGNLNVAAQQVVGLDNIQVGGSSTGVPAETSNLGASLSGVSNASAAASSSSSAAVEERRDSGGPAPLAETALNWLDVFVEGFGEEVCKPSDAECLQRNRKP